MGISESQSHTTLDLTKIRHLGSLRVTIGNNQKAVFRNLRRRSAWKLRNWKVMGVPFDFAPERPEHIDAILNGLDRYNPETTQVFQDYVTEQCETKTYDCYANLALLKL